MVNTYNDKKTGLFLTDSARPQASGYSEAGASRIRRAIRGFTPRSTAPSEAIDKNNYIWLISQVLEEHLLGARAEMLEEENDLLDLMAGMIHIHIYITPPSPMQECDFTLEYDVNYVQSTLG